MCSTWLTSQAQQGVKQATEGAAGGLEWELVYQGSVGVYTAGTRDPEPQLAG